VREQIANAKGGIAVANLPGSNQEVDALHIVEDSCQRIVVCLSTMMNPNLFEVFKKVTVLFCEAWQHVENPHVDDNNGEQMVDELCDDSFAQIKPTVEDNHERLDEQDDHQSDWDPVALETKGSVQ
jgi:hypothetical protein